MELLIKTRDDVGIPLAIPTFLPILFVDQRRTSVDVTAESDIKNAVGQNIQKSIKLRKCVATVSQLLNSQTHELGQLATFMGHDIEVHREFCRLKN